METKMKLCIDCKHVRTPRMGISGWECLHPSNIKVDIVTGNKSGYQGCYSMRADMGNCGVEARKFEPKEADPKSLKCKPFQSLWTLLSGND